MLALAAGLPAELRRAIALQFSKTFAKHATPALADSVFAKYRLASKKMINNLHYVLVVKRCTATPRFVALGIYQRHRRHPVRPYLSLAPLDKTLTKQNEYWLAHNKKPARYLAAVFRVHAIHGPWREHDRGAKVVLEPVRSSTAVIGGDTISVARNRVYAMSRNLARLATYAE